MTTTKTTITAPCLGCGAALLYLLVQGEHEGAPDLLPPSNAVAYRGGHICYGCDAVVTIALTERQEKLGAKILGRQARATTASKLVAAVRSLGPHQSSLYNLKQAGFSKREVEAAVRRGDLVWKRDGGVEDKRPGQPDPTNAAAAFDRATDRAVELVDGETGKKLRY